MYPVLTPELFTSREALLKQVKQFVYDEFSTYEHVTDVEWIRRKMRSSAVHVCKTDHVLVEYWRKEVDRLIAAHRPAAFVARKAAGKKAPASPFRPLAPQLALF